MINEMGKCLIITKCLEIFVGMFSYPNREH